MRIRDVRPGSGPPRHGIVRLCRFNLEPTAGVVVYDCSLEQAEDGRIFLYAPMRAGGLTANFSPDVRRRVIALARDALKDAQHDRATAA